MTFEGLQRLRELQTDLASTIGWNEPGYQIELQRIAEHLEKLVQILLDEEEIQP